MSVARHCRDLLTRPLGNSTVMPQMQIPTQGQGWCLIPSLCTRSHSHNRSDSCCGLVGLQGRGGRWQRWSCTRCRRPWRRTTCSGWWSRPSSPWSTRCPLLNPPPRPQLCTPRVRACSLRLPTHTPSCGPGARRRGAIKVGLPGKTGSSANDFKTISNQLPRSQNSNDFWPCWTLHRIHTMSLCVSAFTCSQQCVLHMFKFKNGCMLNFVMHAAIPLFDVGSPSDVAVHESAWYLFTLACRWVWTSMQQQPFHGGPTSCPSWQASAPERPAHCSRCDSSSTVHP